MCNPAATIAALSIVAGQGLQMMGQRRAEKAQKRAINRFDTTQRGLEQQARDTADKTRTLYEKDKVQGAMSNSVMDRVAAYDSANKGNILPKSNEIAVAGGNQRVLGAIAGARARAGSAARAEGARRANANSFADFLQAATLEGTRNSQQIGLFGNMAAGNRAVLPFTLQKAAGKGQGLRTLGQLLSAFGQIAASYAGAKSVPTPTATPTAIPTVGTGPNPFGFTTGPF